MNAMNQALNVYNAANAAITAKAATAQDEVVVALWELVQEQESTISAQSYKIAILESKDSDTLDSSPEALAVLNRVRALH